MSIEDILRSVGDLAVVVNEKLRELDALKAQLTDKLSVINQYVSELPIDNKSELINDDELIEMIKQHEDSNFILLPKKLVKIPDFNNSQSESKSTKEINSSIRQRSLTTPNVTSNSTSTSTSHAPFIANANSKKESKYYNKSKKICSYCNKAGHSRARCFTRLNNDPSSNSEKT